MPGLERSLAITMRQPLGVVAAIVPFNYPAELWSHKAAGALAAGNAVITKPPEECPLTVIRIAEMMEAAGLPKAAHQVVTGLGEVVGAALVRAQRRATGDDDRQHRRRAADPQGRRRLAEEGAP